MLKPTILAVVGLAVVAPAVSADTIIPILPRPDLAEDLAPFESPAFDRMVDLCERFGVACGLPGDEDSDLLDLIPLAEADAAKQWDLYAEEWEELAELYDDYVPVVPHLPRIHGHYGWQENRLSDIDALLEDVQERLDRRPAPLVHTIPRPHFGWQHPFGHAPQPYSFGHRLPLNPHLFRGPHRPGNSVIILPSR